MGEVIQVDFTEKVRIVPTLSEEVDTFESFLTPQAHAAAIAIIEANYAQAAYDIAQNTGNLTLRIMYDLELARKAEMTAIDQVDAAELALAIGAAQICLDETQPAAG